MKRRSYPERIRAALFLAIKRTAANLDACVKLPGKDFSRTRKLPLQAMLLMLIGMGSGSLSKELYDWFGYTSSTATASAFVQQRNKIRPEAVKMIFNEFVSSTTPTATFQGYRLFAVDGSDLRLPSDPTNDFSLIRNAEGQKQYNLAHLNAMFDLMSKVYVDATMQGKKGMNEHSALVSMIDRSNIPGKVIVLMDRGYESFNNIAHLQEKEWNFIIRAKESYGMISNLQLPNSEEFDVDTTLTLTRRQTKETLALLSAYPERYRWIQPHTTLRPKLPICMICTSASSDFEFLTDATRPSILILTQRPSPLKKSKNFIISVGELKHPLENLSISLDYPVCTARKQTFYYKRFLLD